eukprot:symbB.v1.2.009605.t1/scaffold613.1/size180894/13
MAPRLDKAKEADVDGRLLIERMLLPPGTTFSRAATTVLFFFMLYCFVWTSWYIAVGGDTCRSQREAAEVQMVSQDKMIISVGN